MRCGAARLLQRATTRTLEAMTAATAHRRADRSGRVIRTGDYVRVGRAVGSLGINRDYQRSFRQCQGRIFRVVGWDKTGLAWIPLRNGEVLSIEPRLLSVVRRAPIKARLVSGGLVHGF